MILALDPGYAQGNGAGWAAFDATGLWCCGYVRGPAAKTGSVLERALVVAREVCMRAPDVIDELVSEWPKMYRPDGQKGDQNDLPGLAACAAAVAALYDSTVRVTAYLPHEWTGGLTEEQLNARILSRLAPDEQAVLEIGARRPTAKELDQNALDAVGIGLHHLGRLKARKVYPR